MEKNAVAHTKTYDKGMLMNYDVAGARIEHTQMISEPVFPSRNTKI